MRGEVENDEEKIIKGGKRTFLWPAIQLSDFLLRCESSPEAVNEKVKAMFQTRLCCIQSSAITKASETVLTKVTQHRKK